MKRLTFCFFLLLVSNSVTAEEVSLVHNQSGLPSSGRVYGRQMQLPWVQGDNEAYLVSNNSQCVLKMNKRLNAWTSCEFNYLESSCTTDREVIEALSSETDLSDLLYATVRTRITSNEACFRGAAFCEAGAPFDRLVAERKLECFPSKISRFSQEDVRDAIFPRFLQRCLDKFHSRCGGSLYSIDEQGYTLRVRGINEDSRGTSGDRRTPVPNTRSGINSTNQ